MRLYSTCMYIELSACACYHCAILSILHVHNSMHRLCVHICMHVHMHSNPCADMQMQPFGNPAPDGWSEFSDAWLSGNQMLQRQRQVNESIPQLGHLREYAERVALRTGRELIKHFFVLMLGGDYTNEDILLAYKQLYADEPFNLAAPEAE